MVKRLSIAEFVAALPQGVVADVRTPAEFDKGHMPGAHNLPLFSNDERAAIGTAYKRQGRETAIKLGLEVVGPRLAQLVTRATELAQNKPLLIYCWRGGMRSASVAWLLDLYGLPVTTLNGGYKSYRHWALQQLGVPRRLTLVAGATGSGKTELLQALHAAGQQVVDLEALAHHKGSAFGALGQTPQPTTEQFENELAWQLHQLQPDRNTWVEDESRTIGRVVLPASFWQQMQTAPAVVLHAAADYRCRRLVAEYGRFTHTELETALDKIQRKLGGLAHRQALEALHAGDLHTVARITLQYYDKTYAKGLVGRKAIVKTIDIEDLTLQEIINVLPV
jgi:tRNA 2-selenouridine synthase